MRIGVRQTTTLGVVSAVVAALTVGTAGWSDARGTPTRPAWTGFAANAQHTGQSSTSPQPLSAVHWHVKVDRRPPTLGDDGGSIAHYASPMITSRNTVVVPTRIGPRRGFDLIAYAGADGSRKWLVHTDYTVPAGADSDRPPPLPASLLDDHRVAVAGAGGTLLVRRHVNGTQGVVHRLAFYGNARWRAHRAAYRAAVQVTTPLTTGPDGTLYFGFSATRDAPGRLRSGIARIDPSGRGSWVSARRLAGSGHPSRVALNAAPALSPNGHTAYTAVIAGRRPVLVGFDAAGLRPKYRHPLRDPQTHRAALVDESSSATPTVGPDGDVYYGVLGNPVLRHDFRGWLLHFDHGLRTVGTPGSFGWDQTASVVPAASVPGYAGTSAYLLVSKYNDYAIAGHGDGRNEIALLDPHAAERDEYSRVRVMEEVRSALSPLHPPGTPAGNRYEWCVNSMAVDPATGTVIANNEDGHVYTWDLGSGRLTEDLRLTDPRGQAYTETVIGPDGTSYAIANAILFAVGS
jgi:hypothetical protein